MLSANLYNSLYLADNIKSMAKSKKIVIKDMLVEIGLNSNAMSSLRHGKAISAESLAKIADYLGCSVDYLLGRTDDPNLHPAGEIEKAFYSAPASIQDAIKKLLDIDHTKG